MLPCRWRGGAGGWTLRSTRARLQEGGITAWDGFEWTGEDDVRATGSALRATKGRIDLEGEPARLRFAGLEWEADSRHAMQVVKDLQITMGRSVPLTNAFALHCDW